LTQVVFFRTDWEHVPSHKPAATESVPLPRSAKAAIDVGPASQSNVLGMGLFQGRECYRGVPLALAPFVIRWGETASSDLLRRSFRCTICGGKGATLMLPSHVGGIGIAPFPAVTELR
jgi:hypothetical protein